MTRCRPVEARTTSHLELLWTPCMQKYLEVEKRARLGRTDSRRCYVVHAHIKDILSR